MQIDPEATLRCWAVDVDVAGRIYTIPALPARVWILATYGSWADIVPGLLEGDTDDLEDGIASGLIDPEECKRAARAALEAAAGTRWWTASRLAHTAGDAIGSELLLRGVDPDRVSFGAWLLAAYRIATRHAKDVEVARLDAELDSPPPDLAPEQWWDDSQTVSGFAAAMTATRDRNQSRAVSSPGR